MLSTSTLDSLKVVISNLDTAGAVITTVGDSPFQNIAQTIERTTGIKDFNAKMFENPSKIDFADLSRVAFNIANANDNESEMNLKMDEFVDAISTAVTNNVNLAKTVVIPKITEISERLTQRVNVAMGSEGLGFDIVPVIDNPLIHSDDLATVVEKYNTNRSGRTRTPVINSHKERSFEQILSLMRTGKTDFDVELTDYFKDKKDFVTSVYYHAFLIGNQSAGQIIEDIYTRQYNFNAYLVIFLIARGLLMGEVDDTVTGYSLNSYRAAISDIIESAGHYLYVEIKLYKESKANNRLVVRYPEKVNIFKNDGKLNKILVIGEVYEEYLASGGKPEAVLGSALDKRYLRMEDIQAYEIDLIKTYNSNLAKLRMNSDALGLSELRRGLIDELHQLMSYEVTDVNWQKLYDEQVERIARYAAELDRHYLGEIPRAVKRGICQCIFPNTDVLTIIDNIEFIDPEGKLPINEVVALAIIDWIVQWCMTEQLSAGSEAK